MKTRLLISVLVCAAFSTTAYSQNETVTVRAESLPGLWKIGFPAWSYQSFLNYRFGPVYDDFCRLAGARDNLYLSCLYMRFRVNKGAQRGAVTLSGNRLHVVWGSGMVRGVLDLAQQASGIFTGNFSMRYIAIPFTAPEQLSARKIALSENTPDADGRAGLLTKLLNDVAAGTPVTALAQLRDGGDPPGADDLSALGKIESLIYLGRTASSAEEAALYKNFPRDKDEPPPPPKPVSEDDGSSVYAVEFEKGERLCAVYQRADGVVDDFRCA